MFINAAIVFGRENEDSRPILSRLILLIYDVEKTLYIFDESILNQSFED